MPPFPFAAPSQIRLGLTSSASACERRPCLTLLGPPVITALYAKPLKSVLAPVPLKTRNEKLASQMSWDRFWKSRSSERRLQRLRSRHLVANKSQRQRGPHLRTGSHGAPEGASPVSRQGAPLDHGLHRRRMNDHDRCPLFTCSQGAFPQPKRDLSKCQQVLGN